MSKMQSRFLDTPCRNFCILSTALFTDPKDGLEKMAVCSYTTHGAGMLAFIEPKSNTGESFMFPMDEGAWALVNDNNESLILGTCAKKGAVLRFDLKSRTWYEPLRTETETYIWQFVRGADGMLYGGTYPGCRLLRYDPAQHTLEDLGQIPEGTPNLYSRNMNRTGDYVLVSCGMNARQVYAYHVFDKSLTPLGRLGDMVIDATDELVLLKNDDGNFSLVDAKSFSTLPKASDESESAFYAVKPRSRGLRMADGATIYVRGQEYAYIAPGEETPLLRPIPVLPPATGIMTISSGPDKKIWGCTLFGMTIFHYDPADGTVWNSVNVPGGGGEVYGMAFSGRKLYMTAYAGGEHVVYDIDSPWTRDPEAPNPRILREIGSDGFIRPHTRSFIGPDGNVWTGWMGRYGLYAGALTRIDTKTEEVTLWQESLPCQSVSALAMGDRLIYASTWGHGNGLSDTPGPYHLYAVDTDGVLVHDVVLPENCHPETMAFAQGRVILAARGEIRIYDASLSLLKAFETASVRCMAELDDGRLLAFQTDGWAKVLDPITGTLTPYCETPGGAITATVMDGKAYYVDAESRGGLYVIEPEA